MILKSLLFLTLFVNQAWSQSIDMINQARVDHPWIEIGFVDVDTTSWVRVDALGTNYDNAVILTALPDLGGELYTQGFSTATRIRNVVNSGNVHFEVKLFQPNDSFCSKEWYVPIPIGPVEIGYTIVEYGSFFVANKHQFIIGTGLANRTRATLVAKSPDFHPLPYPFGCSAATCVFPQSINLTELGAVATIQSLVYDTYLLLRISSVVRRQIIVVLTPHDSGDPSYFDFPEPETVGFMAFRTGITLDCIERLTVETTRWNNVTSVKLYYPFFWQYVKTPAVFGMVISQNSLVDSMALRVFSRTLTDAYVITQEDVCDEENPIHTTPEFASALVAGESLEGTEICDAIYRAPTNAPTSAPTFAPTSVPTNAPTEAPQCVYNFLLYDLFGDGWQNVKLRVVTDGVTTDYSVVCACDMIEVRSSSCVLDISMITVEESGEPITYWEPLWATKINGVTYPGDFRTTMHIEIDVVTVENAPDTDPTSEGNQCKPCTASDDDGNGGNGGGGPPGPGRGRGRGRGRGGDDGPGRGRGGAGRGRGRGGADDGAVGNGNGRGADDGAIGNGKGNDDGAAGNGNGKGADDATPGSGNGKGNDDGAAAGNGKGNDDGRGKGADDDKCDEKNGKKCDKQRKLGQGDDGNHNTGIAQFKIFDQFGNGWYKNGGYSSGVCDSELCPNNDDTCVEDTIDLPDILTYPKWYVMNAARTQLVDFGSMCENPKGIEGCMITLPDGRYVFRVAGYNLDGDLASWRFCGIYGVNHQELQFQMVDGVCVPRALLSAEDYCTGFKTLVSLSGSLSIAGVTIDNLNEYDTNALYTQILALFPNTVAVDILDRALVGGYLVVNFVVTVSPEDYGLDGSVSNNIEACLNSVYATAQSESQSHFLTGLTSAIQSSPLGQNDPLAHVTGVTLTSLEVVQVQYVSKDDNSVLHPLEMTYSNNESSVQNGVSIVTIVALVCGAIFMAAATAFTIMRSRGVGHVPLSDKSSHLDNSINKVSVGTSLDIEK